MMTTWVVISWIFVALLTAVNVFVFLKLKKASDQMMKMAFPNAKNMNDAVSQMQGQMSGMMGGKAGMPPNLAAMMSQMNQPQMQAQMKAAMEMLSKMQNGPGKGRR